MATKKKNESIVDKIMGMSQMQQIGLAAACFGILMVLSIGIVAIAMHAGNGNKNQVVEEESRPKNGVVDIPSYTPCSVATSSLKEDLTICIKDNFDEKVNGQKFQVKLVSSEDAAKLNEYITTIKTLNVQIAKFEANGEGQGFGADVQLDPNGNIIVPEETNTPLSDGNSVSTPNVDTSSTDGLKSSRTGEALTDYESLLYQKGEAISEYSKSLSMMKGETFTDDDGDGMIHIVGIAAGNYVACIFPTGGFDPSDYMMNVTVKATLDYVVDENVMDKVFSEGLAGDEENVRDIDGSAGPSDSVSYVESETKTNAAKYTAVKSQKLVKWVAPTTKNAQKEYEVPETTKAATTSSGVVTVAKNDSFADMFSRWIDKFTFAQNIKAAEVTPSGEEEELSSSETASTEQSSESTSSSSEASSSEASSTETPTTTAPQTTEAPKKVKKVASLKVTDGATLFSDVDGENSCTLNISAENLKDIKVSYAGSGATLTHTTTAISVKADSVADSAAMAIKVTGTVSIAGAPEEQLTVEVKLDVIGYDRQLYGADGSSTIYVDNAGKHIATYKDYVAGKDYYQKSGEETKSTFGWQKSKNGTVYYDKNGKAVSGAQVINGVKYTFDTKGKLITKTIVDVNKYSGNIDWNKASMVVNQVYVRAGFRGTNGTLAEDSNAATYIKGASDSNIKVGLYITSRATNEVEAVEEASLAVKVAEAYGGVTLPIYIELGAPEQQKLSKSEMDAIVSAFGKVVRSAGYNPGVYGSKSMLNSSVSSSACTGMDVWVGEAGNNCSYKGAYEMVNYNQNGKVPGFPDKVSVSQKK